MTNNHIEQLIRNRIQLHGESFAVAKRKLDSFYSKGSSLSSTSRPMELLFDEEDWGRLLPLLERDKAILISGDSVSGKTTTLQSLVEFESQYLNKRTVLIEDFNEIGFDSEASSFIVELVGNDSVPAVDLVRSAVRMRPDTIAFQEIESSFPENVFNASLSGQQVITTMLSVPFGNPLPLNRHLRSQVVCLSAIVEQVSIAGNRDASSAPSRNILTNVVVITPELAKIINRNDRAAEVEYFTNPSTPTMSSKLAGLLREGVIRETVFGFELC